jgi:hypothetical protein
MNETLEAIEERLSPEHLKDQAMTTIANGAGVDPTTVGRGPVLDRGRVYGVPGAQDLVPDLESSQRDRLAGTMPVSVCAVGMVNAD